MYNWLSKSLCVHGLVISQLVGNAEAFLKSTELNNEYLTELIILNTHTIDVPTFITNHLAVTPELLAFFIFGK